MSLQLLIDAVRNAGAIDAPATLAPVAARSGDFGDQVQAAFERNFPRAVTFGERSNAGSAAPTPAGQEPERFKADSSADFGDRVAAAFDRLFPPRGAIS
jgi:hypothetical protein